MVCFHAKNLGLFWRALELKKVGIFKAIWDTSWPFGICILCQFGYILRSFGTFSAVLVFCTEKNLATLCQFASSGVGCKVSQC
jgi:hypothetical protein